MRVGNGSPDLDRGRPLDACELGTAELLGVDRVGDNDPGSTGYAKSAAPSASVLSLAITSNQVRGSINSLVILGPSRRDYGLID